MRTLNRELGVSHSLINARFGSKQDLWYTTVDWAFELAYIYDAYIQRPLAPIERCPTTSPTADGPGPSRCAPSTS